jgi:hypothetical protein
MRGLSLSKETVQVAAGLATVLGGFIAAVTFFGGLVGGGGSDAQTASPTAVAGEFLRVRFGTVQDQATLLPGGPTSDPDGDVRVCPSETLYAWVEHTYKDGAVLEGALSNRDGILFRSDVPVDERASNFWISARVTDPGIHTLTLKPTGATQAESWRVNVTC